MLRTCLPHVVSFSFAMTAGAAHQAGLLRDLLKMQCGNGLMHESVDVDSPMDCTRPIFEWSNAMLVVMAEQLLGLDCSTAAEEEQLRTTVRRDSRAGPPPGRRADLRPGGPGARE